MASSPDLSDETPFPLVHRTDVEGFLRKQIFSAVLTQPRWEAIIEAWSEEIQLLESEVFTLATAGGLDYASDYALVLWSKMLGQPVGGVPDGWMRRLLRAGAISNYADGGRYWLYRTWLELVGPNILIEDSYPAGLWLQSSFEDFDSWTAHGLASRTANILINAVGAGIGYSAVVGPSTMFLLVTVDATAISDQPDGPSYLGTVLGPEGDPLGTVLPTP